MPPIGIIALNQAEDDRNEARTEEGDHPCDDVPCDSDCDCYDCVAS